MRGCFGGCTFCSHPPALPLETVDMDELYDLPFNRAPHPMYGDASVPAYETVKNSLVIMRGCFGGCTFCSITEHEGRVIQTARPRACCARCARCAAQGEFHGVITDLGGPTANMYKMRCKDEKNETKCRRLSCVHPGICENLETDHGPLIDLMKRVREEPGVKHVFIASGVRYDLASRHARPEFIEELRAHHTGGQLSVAPEHVTRRHAAQDEEAGDRELRALRRGVPLRDRGGRQGAVPRPLLHHRPPGLDADDMVELALYLKKKGYRPRQVQDFIPTPMSMATTMYYTGHRSAHDEAVLHGQGAAREAHAEGAAPLLGSGAA